MVTNNLHCFMGGRYITKKFVSDFLTPQGLSEARRGKEVLTFSVTNTAEGASLFGAVNTFGDWGHQTIFVIYSIHACPIQNSEKPKIAWYYPNELENAVKKNKKNWLWISSRPCHRGAYRPCRPCHRGAFHPRVHDSWTTQ